MLYYCLLINLSVHKKLPMGVIVGLFIFLKPIFVIECIFLVDALGAVTCPKERTVWLLRRFFRSKVHLEHTSLAGSLLSFWCPFEFSVLCSRKLNDTHVPGFRWSTQICLSSCWPCSSHACYVLTIFQQSLCISILKINFHCYYFVTIFFYMALAGLEYINYTGTG